MRVFLRIIEVRPWTENPMDIIGGEDGIEELSAFKTRIEMQLARTIDKEDTLRMGVYRNRFGNKNRLTRNLQR